MSIGAQDGERLVRELERRSYSRHSGCCLSDEKRVMRDAAETIRTQSAELAALRAQVANLMLELEAWRHEWNVAFSHASKNKNRRWVLRCLKDAVDASLDAALAPPQPVAKETKP